ncbi:MAG: aminotransferase, partial [Pseudomonadales bacterium]|nr:aminotransferase [Pseudomonadales bacterium]
MFRFDKFVSREGSYSLKWEKYAGTDILPFWVADMDLPSPPFELDAVRLRARHPIHGYSTVPDSLTEALRERASNDFGWSIEEDWDVWIPGLEAGMHHALR